MPAIDSGISQMLFSPRHQGRSTEVRSQDCNHGFGCVMGAALTLTLPNPRMYMTTKSTTAKPRCFGYRSTHCMFRYSVDDEFTKQVMKVSTRGIWVLPGEERTQRWWQLGSLECPLWQRQGMQGNKYPVVWGIIPSKEQLCWGDGGCGHEESHSGESLPSAQRGRDQQVGRETEWKPCPLHITQQWCFVPSVILVSSTKIPGCRVHHSHPLGLSPYSQQQSSPWVCSPNPTFMHPAPVHTNRYMSRAGTCRAVSWTICVCLIQLCLPKTSCWVLLQRPLNILFCLNWSPHHWEGFPRCGNLSSPSAPHLQGCRFHPAFSPLLFFFFFLSSYLVKLESFLSIQVSEVLC